MLRLPSFRYHQPASLDEALSLLAASGPSTRVVAGGTDLWPNMKRRHQSAETVISLMQIPELAGIQVRDDAYVVGATTLLDDLTRSELVRRELPALAEAAEAVSSPPLRNMATLGGNLCVDTRCTYYNQTEEWRRSIDYCMKEAGTVCWVAPGSSVCWAHSASDTAPMLAALGARVVLRSAQGDRTVAIDELFRNDGIRYLAIQPGEVLTAVEISRSSAANHCRTVFRKLRRRGSIDFAVLTVAAAVWPSTGSEVERARLVLGSVASRPLRVPDAEAAIQEGGLAAESIEAAAKAARRAATPMDNTDFKTQWRGLMAERWTRAALEELAE